MTIKAVVFDMDGVLIDAKDWHYEALNKALGYFGLSISRYDHLVTFDGLPTRKKLEMLSIETGLPTALHPFINDLKQQFTTDLVHSRCKPVFQHEYALSRLKAEGYHLAVASNSIRSTVELMMQKSRLDVYLDLMLSNEDVSRAKPDPEIYETANRHFKIQPHECLVVEDNEKGIAAARAAGTHVLVVDSVFDVTHDRIKGFMEESSNTGPLR
ncbi:MAG: HAD-IA family hydrolase [Leptospiraceae bacterium]|nr:HAD-IA family hydrolase [Leptospiraceae bacterium]